jgi:hypothetical protein
VCYNLQLRESLYFLRAVAQSIVVPAHSNCFRRCYAHFARINLSKDNEKYCHILNLKCFSLFAVLIFYKSDMDGYSRWQQKT